ncbi:Pectin lyase fold/virulence factor [Pseudocohnilembus persalinus]|uniref:Pectin lyase fold/virulence factor n=1 Tax=Pseudocohnilembus persalinus TaxID=266149 RepID=A0A0V0QCA5_PSEPJ|nr:Pectin lyase fold/virulence factor [Pseudocohnilembus persalinus]|eukprot:KRW99878.1 Pectin lyase fold/virulence factor [Pseudocohnilembus persalinus]
MAISKNKVKISNNLFQRNFSYKGGNIFAYRIRSFQIIDNEFFHNMAELLGGCVFTDSGYELNVIGNIFQNNTAKNGGVLFINRQEETLIIQSNNFTQNSAYQSGGAIYLQDNMVIYASQIYCSENLFQENSAKFGGVVALKGWEQGIYFGKFFEKNQFLRNLAVYQGGILYASQGLNNKFPFYGIGAQNNYFEGNRAPSGPLIKLANLDQSLVYQSKYQSLLEEENFFLENTGIYEEKYMLNCTNGEYYDNINFECQVCSKGYFNYNIRENFYECQECPEKAICEGNYTGLFVEQGYWVNQNYDTVIKCKYNPDACQGGKYFEEQCYTGYFGVACQIVYELPYSIQEAYQTATSLIQGYSSQIICVLPNLVLGNEQLSELVWEYIIMLLNFTFIFLLVKVFKLQFLQRIPLNSFINQYFIFNMPSFVEKSVTLISCQQVGDQKFVLYDYNIECYGEIYFRENFAFGVGTLVLWVVLFPAYVFWAIQKTVKVQESFQMEGFIVSDQSLDNQGYDIYFRQQKQMQQLNQNESQKIEENSLLKLRKSLQQIVEEEELKDNKQLIKCLKKMQKDQGNEEYKNENQNSYKKQIVQNKDLQQYLIAENNNIMENQVQGRLSCYSEEN